MGSGFALSPSTRPWYDVANSQRLENNTNCVTGFFPKNFLLSLRLSLMSVLSLAQKIALTLNFEINCDSQALASSCFWSLGLDSGARRMNVWFAFKSLQNVFVSRLKCFCEKVLYFAYAVSRASNTKEHEE